MKPSGLGGFFYVWKTLNYEIRQKPFTDEEMLERARKANADYEAGRYLTIEELIEEVKKW
jgi:hypothetical protein